MASVNDWRLELAKKEAEERNKFGWRDIMDLLTTGFSAYQGIEGIKQGRAAQELNERRQQFDEDQARLGPRVPDPVPMKPPSRDEIDRDMFKAITQYGGSFDESQFEQPRPAGFPEDAPLPNRMHRGVDYGDLTRAYRQPGPEPLTALDQSLIDYRNAQTANMGREGDESLTPYQTYGAMNEGWSTTQPQREVVSGIPPALMRPEMRGEMEPYGTGIESAVGPLYPPLPSGGVTTPDEPTFDPGKAMQLLGFTDNPNDPYKIEQMPGMLQSADAILQSGGQVPWDNDDLLMAAQELNARPPLTTPDEFVRDNDRLYGPGWGLVFYQTVRAMGKRR